MSFIEDIKLNMEIKKIRKARRKEHAKKQEDKKLYSELDTRLKNKTAELDALDEKIAEMKTNIETLKKVGLAGDGNINEDLGAEMFIADLADLKAERNKLTCEIANIKEKMQKLSEEIDENNSELSR